jgi:hypothetical protein
MNSTVTDIRSRQAQRVEIRPLAADDRTDLADAFSRLNEETRRRRFGTRASRLSERELDRLINVDHRHHEALAAFAPGTVRIVTRLLVYVSAENRPVMGWIARTGGSAEVYDRDATLYGIPLNRFDEEWRAT